MKVSEFFKSPDLLKWFVNNGIALLVLLFTMTLLYKYFDMRIDQIKEEDEFILQEKMDKASKLDLGKYIVVQGELKTGGYTNTGRS